MKRRRLEIRRPYQSGIVVYQLVANDQIYYRFLGKYIDRRDFEKTYTNKGKVSI